MKTILPGLLCVAFLLPITGVLAQNDAPTIPRLPRPVISQDNAAPAHLDGNYVLTLTATDKDQPAKELAVVVAAASFNVSSAQPATTFSGKLFPQEGGLYEVSYQLGSDVAVPTGKSANGGFENIQYRSVSTVSSVLLRLGEPVQIIRDGDRTYTLRIDRCKPEAPMKTAEAAGPGIGFMR